MDGFGFVFFVFYFFIFYFSSSSSFLLWWLGGNRCRTCGMNADHCPGHCGHIDLPTPMYHPMLFDTCYKLLRSTCFYCHRFRFDPRRVALVRRRVDLLDLGLLLESHELSVRCTFGLTDDIMGTGGSRSNRTTEYDLEEIETVYHELLASALEREHCNGADPISQLRKHMRASILSMHVRNERRRLVRDLLRDAVAAKKCFYCSLYGSRFFFFFHFFFFFSFSFVCSGKNENKGKMKVKEGEKE